MVSPASQAVISFLHIVKSLKLRPFKSYVYYEFKHLTFKI